MAFEDGSSAFYTRFIHAVEKQREKNVGRGVVMNRNE